MVSGTKCSRWIGTAGSLLPGPLTQALSPAAGGHMGCLDPGTVHIRRWSRAMVTSCGEGCARTAEPEDSTREEEGEGAL